MGITNKLPKAVPEHFNLPELVSTTLSYFFCKLISIPEDMEITESYLSSKPLQRCAIKISRGNLEPIKLDVNATAPEVTRNNLVHLVSLIPQVTIPSIFPLSFLLFFLNSSSSLLRRYFALKIIFSVFFSFILQLSLLTQFCPYHGVLIIKI